MHKMGFINNILNTRKPSKVALASLDRASKGTIRSSWYGQTKYTTGTPSPENLNLILKLYQMDPVVQTGTTVRSDAILSSGYTIEGSKSAKKSAEELLKKIKFDYFFLEQVTLNALLYQHVFIEIERNGKGAPTALHVLETPYMEINADEHGDILGYTQRGENGQEVKFPVDDIAYAKFNSVSSSVWGEIMLSSLGKTLTSKNQIEKFIEALAITNSWRSVLNTNMTDDNIGEFMSYYASAQTDATMPLVLKRGANTNKDDTSFDVLRDPAELKEFLGTLDYFRSQALMALKVPPIMVGLTDNSNRSNSDGQMTSFSIANQSSRKKLDDIFNNNLFPKIGLTNVVFSWNPIDNRSEKEDLEIAEKLMNMGAEPDMIEQFLRDSGLELPEGKLFKEPEQMPEGTGNITKSEELYPSRKRKAEGEPNQRIGTGAEGTTREDQLK